MESTSKIGLYLNYDKSEIAIQCEPRNKDKEKIIKKCEIKINGIQSVFQCYLPIHSQFFGITDHSIVQSLCESLKKVFVVEIQGKQCTSERKKLIIRKNY